AVGSERHARTDLAAKRSPARGLAVVFADSDVLAGVVLRRDAVLRTVAETVELRGAQERAAVVDAGVSRQAFLRVALAFALTVTHVAALACSTRGRCGAAAVIAATRTYQARRDQTCRAKQGGHADPNLGKRHRKLPAIPPEKAAKSWTKKAPGATCLRA